MKISEAYKEFIHYHISHGNKKNTITNYDYHILQFKRFVGSDNDINVISNELIYEYSDYLHNGKYSKGTIISYMRTVRIFCKWLNERMGLDIICKDIPVGTMPARDVPIYSEDEIRQIFEACKSPIKWMTNRNQLFVALMLDSGLRQIEVTRLKWSDIDYKNKRIKVFGKGDKYRYVPLGNTSIRYIEKYKKSIPKKEMEFVFISDDGSQISGNAIRIITNRMKKKLGFLFSSHILRHNFATNYLLDKYEITKQIDMEGLKVIMGHVSRSTTELYVHLVQSLIACRDAPSHLDMILVD